MEKPTLREAWPVWARIAALSFGGPAGQVAVMHRILVEEKHWIEEDRFLHGLSFCMLLPGPEAMQLATYIGWLMHGVRGGLVAGGLFILPGVLAMLGLSWAYVLWGGHLAGLFFGLKAAVLAVLVQAVIRIGRKALKTKGQRVLAGLAFLALSLGLPFPVVIAAAGGIGALTPGKAAGGSPVPAEAKGAWTAGLWALAAWILPVAGLVLALPGSLWAEMALYFSKLAVLTFGGAYAVLAWVAQDAVVAWGWLTPGQMIDGLALAETTPGPLIMVLQFVGFLAVAEGGGGLWAASLGGLLVTYVTFAPCFAWIFLGAPFVERLRQNAALAGALQAVTAAVVGVVAHLGVWFALHLLFGRAGETLWQRFDPLALALAAAATYALVWRKWPMGYVLVGAGLAGVILHLILG
jgi:chromate transporter